LIAKKQTGVRSFLDTNVLVYADAGDEPAKQSRAVELISQHRLAGTGVLSTQVMQEYANVALRKLGLPAALIRERLAFYGRFALVVTSPALISAALDLHQLRGTPFYDALIVQAAISAGCSRLLSEDMQDGATFGGVQVVNPFRD
jgi:predicted nucleic acid-binding protein